LLPGFRNKPTVINNVETLVYAFMICMHGPMKFKELGTSDSRGSKVFSVSGDTPIPGIYELELGMPLISLLRNLAMVIPKLSR
jgi:[NiFe] hydrogenase diaphorase moiety large subunit